ncbi:MAG: hypothetical protein H3C58_15195 [Fimbriimonadaceae bacterium]|nr:hypothetical protein [Fimbriimonadaceae bacterium]
MMDTARARCAMSAAGLILVAGMALGLLVGCSTDENPVSPQKMQEIRQKEAEERANFQPPSNQ